MARQIDYVVVCTTLARFKLLNRVSAVQRQNWNLPRLCVVCEDTVNPSFLRCVAAAAVDRG